MKNNIMPSKIASYNCDGCLLTLSISKYFTDQGRSVGFPYNSEFMKLAILPKKFQ